MFLPERQSGQPSEQADRETTIFTMLAFSLAVDAPSGIHRAFRRVDWPQNTLGAVLLQYCHSDQLSARKLCINVDTAAL